MFIILAKHINRYIKHGGSYVKTNRIRSLQSRELNVKTSRNVKQCEQSHYILCKIKSFEKLNSKDSIIQWLHE